MYTIASQHNPPDADTHTVGNIYLYEHVLEEVEQL